MNEEEIISTFKHWIEYEKANKDKINKADELLGIQQGLLDLYKKEKEKNVEIKQKLEEKNIPIETLLAEFERLENIEDERDAIYEDYQDLGKEAYKLQEELEQEQDKNKKLEERQKKFDDGELLTAKQCKHFEKMTKEYYIHKDKARKMIEEKQNRINQMHPASDCVIIDDLENQIKVLEELLKED